eukprot:m.574589 g.574589  ORF g.574589 m.574589 type:complete len:95 (+) comp57883_c0_seq92:86-370(+)
MTTGESADLQCRLESREWSVQSVQTNPANILLVLLKKSGCFQLIAAQCKRVSAVGLHAIQKEQFDDINTIRLLCLIFSCVSAAGEHQYRIPGLI